jgi:hypothetical protein
MMGHIDAATPLPYVMAVLKSFREGLDGEMEVRVVGGHKSISEADVLKIAKAITEEGLAPCLDVYKRDGGGYLALRFCVEDGSLEEIDDRSIVAQLRRDKLASEIE